MLEILFIAWQVVFLGFFLGVNGSYLLLNVLSYGPMRKRMSEETGQAYPVVENGLELPISLLVPAYNEEKVIVESVRSFLALDYPDYEIIVCLDGSTDQSLNRLIDAFELQPGVTWAHGALRTQPVLAAYVSKRYSKLTVLHKANGGKADALNAALNVSRCPLLCTVDADSILEPDSLRRIAHPFMADPSIAGVGGTIRVANSCTIEHGRIVDVAAPREWLARFQTVEYMRAFLFGRTGFNRLHALPLVSGAFGVFRKTAILEAGGFRTGHVGEDMEIVLRLHRARIQHGKPWKVVSLPDPVCWTEVPEDIPSLAAQRNRWHRGLTQNLIEYRSLMLKPKGKWLSWFALPFMAIGEWLGPLIELLGYAGLLLFYGKGVISAQALAAFGLLALGSGTLLSVSAFILEELSFRVYTQPKDIAMLLAAALLENFGYRQLTVWWRVRGMADAFIKHKGAWGKMERKPFAST